jgi:crossover junction endodeoxyribonuclease RuvC
VTPDLRVLGIDPGSRTTGWGVVERVGGRLRCVAAGVVRTRPVDPMPTRLQAIHRGLVAVLAEHGPTEVAMEEIFTHKSAASALVLGQARGVALLCVAGLPLHTYNASTIKKTASGSGKADKAQVARMVRMLLGLDAEAPADQTDALAIALTHVVHHRPVPGMAVAAPPQRRPRRMSSREQWTAIALRAGVKG